MILLKMVNKIKRSSHRGTQSLTTDQITADIVDCINDARRDVIKLVPKESLRKDATSPIATVASTTTYSLASDVAFPIVFRYTSGGKEYVLAKIQSEREFFEKWYSANSSNNKPLWYLPLGYDGSGNKQIRLWPTPDAVYSINYAYYKDPTGTDLTVSDLNTSFPDFPNYLQDAMWKGGLYYFLKGFDDPGQGVALSDYEKAKVGDNIAENDASDEGLQFKFDLDGKVAFNDSATGIKLE
jgi:hypothetical protein